MNQRRMHGACLPESKGKDVSRNNTRLEDEDEVRKPKPRTARKLSRKLVHQ